MRIHPHTGAPAATVRRNVRGALGCLITTATAAAFAFAHAAEPHPLVGTWSGTWKPGNGVELTVETVQDNTATGIACYPLKEGGFWFYDLYPGVVEATIDRRGRLRYEARGTRFEYRPHRRDADRMQLREKAKGRTHKLAMHRIDAGTATCRSRVRTIADRSQTPAAPTGESPLIGLWRGRWGETDAVTEGRGLAPGRGHRARDVLPPEWRVVLDRGPDARRRARVPGRVRRRPPVPGSGRTRRRMDHDPAFRLALDAVHPRRRAKHRAPRQDRRARVPLPGRPAPGLGRPQLTTPPPSRAHASAPSPKHEDLSNARTLPSPAPQPRPPSPSPPPTGRTSPFLGTWTGTWDSGQVNEFRVLAVDDDGRATALYCAKRPGPGGFGFWFDVTPDTIPSKLSRGGKRIEFRQPNGQRRYRFTLRGDGESLDFRYTEKGKHSTLRMHRTEPAGCAKRISPPTVQ